MVLLPILDLLESGNLIARHEYLVYAPEEQELNYDAWGMIGAVG